jgi:hypothetical protein
MNQTSISEWASSSKQKLEILQAFQHRQRPQNLFVAHVPGGVLADSK